MNTVTASGSRVEDSPQAAHRRRELLGGSMSKLRNRLAMATAVAGLAVTVIGTPVVAAAAASAGTTPAGQHTRSAYLAGYRATEASGHVEGVVVKAVDVPDVSCPDDNFRGVSL